MQIGTEGENMGKIVKAKELALQYGLSKYLIYQFLKEDGCPILERKDRGTFLIDEDDFYKWLRVGRQRKGAIPDDKGIYKWEDREKLLSRDKYYSEKTEFVLNKR